MARPRPLKGRPTTWPSKITAPELAIELYRLISKIQRSDAFDTCHIYTGASLNGEPMIKYKGRVHGLPFVVGSYMGLPYGKQQCNTPGCCNPFHYLPEGADTGRFRSEVERPYAALDIGLEEWVDLVEYHAEEATLTREQYTFEVLRPLIHEMDLSDEQLVSALAHIIKQED